MIVRWKKRDAATTSITCERADGTTTWQRYTGHQAAFFPLHDLTHLAAETTLAVRRGFFGLVAEGWGIGDFAPPWPRGPLPTEAARMEVLVGFLDAERAGGERWDAGAFNTNGDQHCAEKGIAPWSPVSEAALAAIRKRRSELFTRWDALPHGESLVVTFERPA